MSLRTYEIISKYIGKDSGVRVVLEPNACPKCDIVNKVITLPSNIKEENIYAALAEAMHEAGHVRLTTPDVAAVATTQFEHSVLNAIEDIRVDLENFKILPNIKEFYREEMKMLNKNRKDPKDVSRPARILCDLIMYMEDFSDCMSQDQDIWKTICDTKIYENASNLIYYLNTKNYTRAQDELKTICKILQENDNEPAEPNKGQGKNNDKQSGNAKGEEADSGNDNKNKAEDVGKRDNKDEDKGEVPTDAKAGKLEEDLKKVYKDEEKVFALGWEQGGTAGSEMSALGPLALHEQTKVKLTELLDFVFLLLIYEEAGKLNTDNLASFSTGDIDDLFKEQIVRRSKKSKILLVLDASSSMDDKLVDGNKKNDMLVKTTRSIVDILREVQELEGINVDWELAKFCCDMRLLGKDTWETDYRTHNIVDGTNIQRSFNQAQEHILNDYTIDGNRLIILLTDGYVETEQIEAIHKDILKHNQDVRCLILGIGASPQICKLIGDDRNISAQEIADVVIMEAITDMLEGR